MTREQFLNDQFEKWQKCLPERLVNLFYGYNATNKQTEKAVSYKIKDADLPFFVEAMENCTASRLSIHLGCDSEGNQSAISDMPSFSPTLQLSGTDCDNYFSTQWDSNPPFLQQSSLGSGNLGFAGIPVSGAYLFVYSWMKLPDNQLAEAFQALANSFNVRVKSYIFDQVTTDAIRMKVIEPGMDLTSVYVHLGYAEGNPVFNPFGFRPVLELHFEEGLSFEISKHILPAVRGASLVRNADLSYSYFYDFSSPCPPNCPTS